MADIFLSYSSEDKGKVRLIAYALEKAGWSVWWDRKIIPGTMYDKVIEDELTGARCVVVIWTERSAASEWVKNEANAGAERKVLVPLLLEEATIPLAFRRMEAARLMDWNGEEDNGEFKILVNAICSVLGEEKRYSELDEPGDIEELIYEQDEKKKAALARFRLGSGGMVLAGIVAGGICLYYFLFKYDRNAPRFNAWLYYLLLIVIGVSASMVVAGALRLFSRFKKNTAVRKLRYISLVVGAVLIISGAFLVPRYASDKIITIRVFDPLKRAVAGGSVKLYLPGYIRQQSIDNVGQAQFTGVSPRTLRSNIKIEIASDGFENYSVDTIVNADEPVLLTLTPVRRIHISGRIKNAGEIPLRDVEINVDGTRYFAISITDGSYTINLKDYSPGDEITLTTSHKDYEDKTRSFRINGSEMKEVDFVLNPVK